MAYIQAFLKQLIGDFWYAKARSPLKKSPISVELFLLWRADSSWKPQKSIRFLLWPTQLMSYQVRRFWAWII